MLITVCTACSYPFSAEVYITSANSAEVAIRTAIYRPTPLPTQLKLQKYPFLHRRVTNRLSPAQLKMIMPSPTQLN
jgi:hypothetical protein